MLALNGVAWSTSESAVGFEGRSTNDIGAEVVLVFMIAEWNCLASMGEGCQVRVLCKSETER